MAHATAVSSLISVDLYVSQAYETLLLLHEVLREQHQHHVALFPRSPPRVMVYDSAKFSLFRQES